MKFVVVQLLSHVLTLWTHELLACQAPLSMGFPRQEYWRGLPFPSPGDRLDSLIKTVSPGLAGGFFISEPPGMPMKENQIKQQIPENCFWTPSPGCVCGQTPPGECAVGTVPRSAFASNNPHEADKQTLGEVPPLEKAGSLTGPPLPHYTHVSTVEGVK